MNFQNAEFSGVDLRNATFSDSTLRNVFFPHADLRGATFTGALLYETESTDVRIDARTTFSDPPTTFYDSITSRPGCVYEENPRSAEQLPDEVEPLEAAQWVYRRLEALYEDNGLPEAVEHASGEPRTDDA